MSAKKHIFSQIEKKLFMDILKSYSAVVENKNTDSTTLREKNTAWENITREYNASPHVTTEVTNKQLRRLWMNLKQRQRDAITKERQHRMATGGGPSTSGAEIDPDVAVIAPALLVEIPGAIDSDAAFLDSEDASMDIDSNQPDLSQDSTLQQPSTSAAATLQQPSTSAAARPISYTLSYDNHSSFSSKYDTSTISYYNSTSTHYNSSTSSHHYNSSASSHHHNSSASQLSNTTSSQLNNSSTS